LVMAFSKSSLPLLLGPFINSFIMICESMLSVSQDGLLREMLSVSKYRLQIFDYIYTYDFNTSSFEINCLKLSPLIKHWVGGPLPPGLGARCFLRKHWVGGPLLPTQGCFLRYFLNKQTKLII
jgi:hypothetical protein